MGTQAVPRLAAVAIGVLVLAGTALPAAPASAKSVSSSNLKGLEKTISNAKHLTYSATYKTVSNGKSQVISIAQAPPKSNFTTPAGSVIDTGKTTYYCSNQAGKATCVSSGASNPFSGLEELFSPTLAITAFSTATLGLGSRLLGIKATSSSATFAGQPSTCITVTVHGHGGKYCVTKQGILSYSGVSSSTYFELTGYAKSPAASLFALPSGATITTLPGGGSIP